MSTTGKFKEGDRVRVADSPYSDVAVGEEGIVTEVGVNYYRVKVGGKPLSETRSGYLYTESELEMAYNFKVGDKLTVLQNDPLWSGFREGDVVEVVKFPYDAAYPTNSPSGTEYPFGTVQVKSTEGIKRGHEYPLYVGVTHVAKYDQPEPEPVFDFKAGDKVVTVDGTERVVEEPNCGYGGSRQCLLLARVEDRYANHAFADTVTAVKPETFKAGDRVIHKGRERIIDRVCDFRDVEDCAVFNDAYWSASDNHVQFSELTKATEKPTVHQFAVGDRVEVVVDDSGIDEGKYVGKVGTVSLLSGDPATRLPYRVKLDGGQGVGEGYRTWWVAEVKEEDPTKGFKVGDRVVVEGATYAEYRVGQVGTINSVTENWKPTDGPLHRFNVSCDGGTGGTYASKVSHFVEAFEVGKRYKLVGESGRLEYTIIAEAVEGKVPAWLDYAGESSYDSASVLSVDRRSEYIEV